MIGSILDAPRSSLRGFPVRRTGESYSNFDSGKWRLVRVAAFVSFMGLLVVSAVVVLITGSKTKVSSARAHQVAPPLQDQTASPIAPLAGAGLGWHTAATVVPSGTPTQEEYDQALSQGFSSQPGMASAAALGLPAPAIGGGWPSLPVASTPEQWATEFTTAVLDVDYTRQSRVALGAWLQAQEAPELIPGIPSSVSDKVLYTSLLDPGIFGGQPSPIPSDAGWGADAAAGTTQTVSGLLVQADPAWAQMVATGWQPADSRMSELDVSGVLSVRSGITTSAHNFSLQLIVGSSRWHDGYGTVAVAGWKEA